MELSASLSTDVRTILAVNQISQWQNATEVSIEARRVSIQQPEHEGSFFRDEKGASAHVARNVRIIHWIEIVHSGWPNG